MARWLSTCTLVKKDFTFDEEGVQRRVDTCTEVFCNEFSIGHSTWSSMYEMGISADAELQIWDCDYEGQKDVVYGGEWYSVERAYNDKSNPDCKRIVLRRQASDAADPAPVEPGEPPTVDSPGEVGANG